MKDIITNPKLNFNNCGFISIQNHLRFHIYLSYNLDSFFLSVTIHN